MSKKKRKIKCYELNCIDCGYTWISFSGDWSECPMCTSKDVVVIKQLTKEAKKETYKT